MNRNGTPSKIHKIISLKFTFSSLTFYSRIFCSLFFSRLRSIVCSLWNHHNFPLWSILIYSCLCVHWHHARGHMCLCQHEKRQNIIIILKIWRIKNTIYWIVCPKNSFLTLHFIKTFRTYFSCSWSLFCHRIYAYQISINKTASVYIWLKHYGKRSAIKKNFLSAII